jgi:ElaB/YqjD/DUF883 family membrane-anchored ribosome-binding protein
MSTTIEKLAHKAGKNAKDLISRSKQHLAHLDEHAYEAGKQAKEFINTAEENIKRNAESLEKQIKARPFVAVGSALVLGMVIAKIFGRSRD